MNNISEKIIKLIEYVNRLDNGEKKVDLDWSYQEELQTVKPRDVFEVITNVLKEDAEPIEILKTMDSVINIFYRSLEQYKWVKPDEDDFICDLMDENKALNRYIDSLRTLLKEENLSLKKALLLEKLPELYGFNDHYRKKELILFPYLNAKICKFNCKNVLQTLHDLLTTYLEAFKKVIQSEESQNDEVNSALSNLLFTYSGVLKKEELILFPVASEMLNESDWSLMFQKSNEFDFTLIKENIEKYETPVSNKLSDYNECVLRADNGMLTLSQIMSIFQYVPVDLLFCDENNKIRFFNRPDLRLFKKSNRAIGRDIEDCHPPESLDQLLEIIGAFRSGIKEQDSFFIDYHGQKVMIQYIAVREHDGTYKGMLEVVQVIEDVMPVQ